MSGAGRRAVDVGECTAAGAIPSPNRRWDVFRLAHFQYSDPWREATGDRSHGWVVRREERTPGLFVIDLLEIKICTDGAGSSNSRSVIDRQKQALQVGIRAEWIVCALQYSRSTIEPAPRRDVRDCVGVANKELVV